MLVISCPHALGLAIPLVIAISTSLAASTGILVKDRLASSAAALVDVVLFDKTGTLTRGEHVVTGVAGSTVDDDAILAQAAAVESESEHPLARAIVAAASARGRDSAGERFPSHDRPRCRSIGQRDAGRGRRPGAAARAPARSARRSDGPTTEPGEPAARRSCTSCATGRSPAPSRSRTRCGPKSREAVDGLHERGIRVAMITGDAREVAGAVAADLGIDEVFAEVLPEDKERQVAELQAARAHASRWSATASTTRPRSRAPTSASRSAPEPTSRSSRQAWCSPQTTRAAWSASSSSRSASYRKMVQNLAWAAGYNIVAIPLAAGVLAPWGIALPPAVGAILMSLSTIVVALNAQLLRRLDLRPQA